jgi:hypothetical protein
MCIHTYTVDQKKLLKRLPKPFLLKKIEIIKFPHFHYCFPEFLALTNCVRIEVVEYILLPDQLRCP